MVKKKWLSLIFSLCMILCTTFILSACGDTSGSTGYNPGGNPPEATGGPPSNGDDSDAEIGEDGTMEGGKIANFDDYFLGYTVLANGSGTDYLVSTGDETVKFNDLLDRQFVVLAQDVLRRLSFIYGSGTRNQSMPYMLYLPNTSTGGVSTTMYKKGSSTAMISYTEAFAKLSSNSVSELREIDVKSADDFQKSILLVPANDGEKSKNYLNYSLGALNLEGAIDGQNMSVQVTDDGLGNVTANLVQNTSKKWAWTCTPATYDGLITDAHIQSFKMALAQIVAGEQTVNGTYSADAYNKLLTGINELGFKNIHKEKIADFIYKFVIGETLVNNDVTYGDYFVNNHAGKINSTSITAIKGNASFNENTNPRLFKGYKVVVPAAISQSLTNVFSSSTDSIYPHFMRVNAMLGQFDTVEVDGVDGEGKPIKIQEPTTTGALDLNSIILMPKAGSLPVVLNLQMEVARKLDLNEDTDGANINDASKFAYDIVVDLEINLSFKRGDTVLNISQMVPDQEESSTITLDSKGYVATVPDPNDPQNSQTTVGNGKKMPYTYFLSLYDKFESDMPSFEQYNGYNPLTDTNTLWENFFEYDSEADLLYLNPGNDYLQVSFNILSVKQRKGDNNSELVDYTGGGVVFDISLMPYSA